MFGLYSYEYCNYHPSADGVNAFAWENFKKFSG